MKLKGSLLKMHTAADNPVIYFLTTEETENSVNRFTRYQISSVTE